MDYKNNHLVLKETASVHQVIANIVKASPNSLAIKDNEREFSYGEINHLANLLAKELKDSGIKKGDIVGIYTQKSSEFIIGMLGVLKTGSAFLPLDATGPLLKISNQIKDANVKCVLTTSDFKKISIFSDLNTLNIDTCVKNRNIKDISEDGDDAYLIYTSGTTGEAKGVLVGHEQLINYINSFSKRLKPQKGDNYALASSFTTDLGYTLLFTSLCTGGCLHILSEEVSFSKDLFAKYIIDNSIDVYKLTPTHFAALELPSNNDWVPKKCIIFGGEKLKKEIYEKVSSLCRVINHYGPTESTIGVLTFEGSIYEKNMSVPIGSPLEGVKAYILDGNLKPVTNEPGELYIGGHTVTKGYLNKPDLTAEKYLPDPFTDKLGALMYKTGDIVIQRDRENIEFIERIDRQIKLLGYRIEIDEIESVINSLSYVKHATVQFTQDLSGVDCLVAYIVLNDTTSTNINKDLNQYLDYYKIPRKIVFIENIPLTSNGKLDIGKLPSPKWDNEELADEEENIVQVITSIWTDVLKKKNISKNSNFFELGGHSLLATQITMRIRKSLDIKLPLRQIFESPTIEELAEAIIEKYKIN